LRMPRRRRRRREKLEVVRSKWQVEVAIDEDEEFEAMVHFEATVAEAV